MIVRTGIVAGLALCIAACGGSEPAPDTSETAALPAVETPAVEATVAVAKTGEAIFKKCAACHNVEKAGRNGIGPNLHGIVGAKVGVVPGFAYSTAMASKGGIWDEATLDTYLASPAKSVPGTKMMFAGISDAAERKTLIEYLAAQK